MPSDVRYWIAGNRAFGYTPHRQADGKFYAMIYRYDRELGGGGLLKRRAFGKRRKAKEVAYKWYIKRKATLERLKAARPVKPEPTKLRILQRKIAKADAYIKQHKTRLKLTETLIKKWEKRKRSWQKRLQNGRG